MANVTPDGRSAQLREFSGEHDVDGKCHLQKLAPGADLALVSFCISDRGAECFGDHTQRLGPGGFVDVLGRVASQPISIAFGQSKQADSDAKRGVTLLKLLMPKAK